MHFRCKIAGLLGVGRQRDKFIVIYHSEDLRIARRLANPKANTVYVEKTLTEAAREFGITANALGYKASNEKEGEDVILYSIFRDKLLPAEVFESYGTIRFINEFPLVIYALLNGGTLILDWQSNKYLFLVLTLIRSYDRVLLGNKQK